MAELRTEDYTPEIRTRGIVRPHNEVPLTSQVAGKINRIGPRFEDGAFFSKGDLLVELDDADYKTAEIVALAQVARAKSSHEQEKTRSRQARLNWEELDYEDEPNELVLRLPQLREAKANEDAAIAQLKQARRNLERTKIRAPFDGRVRQRMVGLGQVIGTGTPLGTVFSIDYAEVRLPISRRDMKFLSLPEGPEDSPVAVELSDAVDATNTATWQALIIRTEGTLDVNSLELFAIARVIDPFGRKSGAAPLRIGQPVIGVISGEILKNVLVIPRVAVRQLDRIFLIDREALTLSSRSVTAIWSEEEHLIIREPSIAETQFLAMSHLVYAPDGSEVEILPDLDLEPAGNAEIESKSEDESAQGQ